MSKSTPRTRLSAMKRFYKYNGQPPMYCRYPYAKAKLCVDGIENTYNVFFCSYCFVITKEDIGDMERWKATKDESEFPIKGIQKLLDGLDLANAEYSNIHNILDQTKARGYRYKASELNTSGEFKYLWKYKDEYVKMGILDQAFKIIDDNENAIVYYTGPRYPIFIETSVGICGVLPIYWTGKAREVEIIEAEV